MHANVVGGFPVEASWVFDAYPAARGVDFEGAGVVVQNVLELRVLALVSVAGKHLQHSEVWRQILDHSDVVHVVLKLGVCVCVYDVCWYEAVSCVSIGLV